jgi:hypothetical protein
MAQVVEPLPQRHKALSPNTSIKIKKERKTLSNAKARKI